MAVTFNLILLSRAYLARQALSVRKNNIYIEIQKLFKHIKQLVVQNGILEVD